MMINRARSFVAVVVILVCFAAVAARLFFIQVWNHETLERRVEKLICRERPVQPCRGMILDAHGRTLAMSVRKYTVFADLTLSDELPVIARRLRTVGVTVPAEVLQVKRRTSYLPLVRDLDYETMQRVKALRLDGIGFESEYRREYPEGSMACHVLGVVGKDGTGLEGVELVSNGYLTGEKVKEKRYRDGRGNEIAERVTRPEEARGADVYLTIDRNLQFIAEQEIQKAVKDSRARRGMAIVQDPKTGEILAMASAPVFDPADFGKAGGNLKNPALSDVYEPGSTFKLVTAAAALEEGEVNTSEVIWCEDGKYKLFNHTISDHEKKGFLTLSQIIEYSSNIGCAKIGQRIGKERMYRYIKQFGFASLSGIDLPGEVRGLLSKPDAWSGLSLPVISFGQEVGVTPMQIVNAYSTIANGGLLLEPKVIKEVRNPSGTAMERAERRVVRRVVSEDVARSVKGMLASVVEHGTGQMAKVSGYSVAGKTGTAQKRDPNTGKYSASKYVASFVGMIPANAPRLTILVVLDEPQGDYWGSSRAGPVFQKIASRSVQYLQIAPDQTPLHLCDTRRYASAKLARRSNEE